MSIRLNHDTGLIQVTDSDLPLSVNALGVKLPILPTNTAQAQQNTGTLFFNSAVGCLSYISADNQVHNINMPNIQTKSDLIAGATDGDALYYENNSLVWKELSSDSLFPATGVVTMRPNMRFTNTIIVEAQTDNTVSESSSQATNWYDTDGDDEWEQLQLKVKHPGNGIAGISFQAGTQTGVAIYHSTPGAIKIDATNTYFGGELIAHNGTVSIGSDIRLKKNIKPLGNTLTKVCRLNGHTFQYKHGSDKTHIGFIAQELEKEFPELVIEDEVGTKAVAYAEMTAVLVEAIKELQEEVEELRKPWWKRILGL